MKATKRSRLTNKDTSPKIFIVRSSFTTSDTTTSASLSGFKFGESTLGVVLLLSEFAMGTNIKRICYKSALFIQTTLAQLAQPNIKLSPPKGVIGPRTMDHFVSVKDKNANP